MGEAAEGAKSRATKKSSKARAGAKGKKQSRAKAGRARASRRERGRVVASKRGRTRDRRASRRGRGRQEVAARRSRTPNPETQEAAAAAAPRTVASGISADRVAEIQAALIRAGHFEGPATGQYDEATAGAMKRFQVANGLPATGMPSAHTLKKLGVSKRSNDGYAVPVNSITEQEKKP
jgi:murein L,D-transpeptidase YcbB/YkuD